MEETKEVTIPVAEEKKSLWKSGLQELVIGIVIIIAAFYYYGEITKLETEGGSIRMNRIFLFIYELAGKNVSVGIGVVLGVVFSGVGIKNMLGYFKNK